jgi:hypothetical protein
MLLYAAGIIFFCFFYTAVVFNPEETADNLKRYGGFIPGIRPGKRTEEYLDYVLTRITVVGAAYLTLICLVPEFLIARAGIPFYLGGTSLLIVVNVTMDTVTQIQSHLIAHQYGDLIKKAKLKGGTRPLSALRRKGELGDEHHPARAARARARAPRPSGSSGARHGPALDRRHAPRGGQGGTEIGRMAKIMKAGELVPDDLVSQILGDRLDEPDTEQGVIFDGYPRTQAQAESLDALLAERAKLDHVIELWSTRTRWSTASPAASPAPSAAPAITTATSCRRSRALRRLRRRPVQAPPRRQ